MKTILSLIFCLSFIFNIQAQNITSQSLLGNWYLVEKTETTMWFEKQDINKLRWGSYIKISKGGILRVGHSAQCGNDTNIFRGYGKWEFDSDKIIIKSDIDIHKMGKTFSVNFNDEKKLVLIRF